MPPVVEPVTDIPRLPPRPANGHKGSFGRVLLVAGSRGLSGAAVLSATAALRGGAGLVRVACPEVIQDIVAAGFPCYTTAGFPADAGGRFAADAVDPLIYLANTTAEIVAIGPGLGRGRGVSAVVHAMLKEVTKPMVVDADALYALERPTAETFARPAATVLTPHAGEFARLTGAAPADIAAHRERFAVAFARQCDVVLLLKGSGTLVTDGRRLYTNTTGNPGMATGGTGDVLTGLIAAFIGQGLPAFEAAVLGAWTHGRAGDLAAEDLGMVSLTAVDVLGFLALAIKS